MLPQRTVEQRLSALERDAFQAGDARREIDAHLQHLTGAVGELSQTTRGHSHQLGEIERKLDDHTVRFERIEATQREHTARFDRVEGRLDRVEGRLERIEVVLGAILDHLGVAVPPAATPPGEGVV